MTHAGLPASQTLEKKYLRLTSAPNPATVRPEPVLRAAVELVRARYESYGEERGQEQYIYLWEQLKSIRQDRAVQRIRNDHHYVHLAPLSITHRHNNKHG